MSASWINDTEEVSMDDQSSCEKALNNSLVLRTVMKYLEARDLLELRLVSKLWEEEATIQLLSARRENKKNNQQPFYKVTFKWDYNQLKFLNKLGSLSEFTETYCGDPLRKFPCAQFCFHDLTPDPKTEDGQVPADLFNFLSKYGHQISSLSLFIASSSNSVSICKILRKILFELTPRLKSLTLELPLEPRPKPRVIRTLESESDNEPTIDSTLENLQVVNFQIVSQFGIDWLAPQCKKLVGNILSSAPNLQLISDRSLTFTREIVSAGKIGLVRTAQLDFRGVHGLRQVIEFSQALPQLTHVDLNVTSFSLNDASISLQGLLESSRNTLRTLNLRGRLNSHDRNFRVNFPVMENLWYIHIDWFFLEGCRGRILPRGSNFQSSFPKLSTLSIQLTIGYEAGRSLSDNPFGHVSNGSLSVRKLVITTPEPYLQSNLFCNLPEWFRQAQNLYPNVRVLELTIRRNWKDLPRICGVLWLWKSGGRSILQEIKITIVHAKKLEGNLTEMMDEVLTGFCKENFDRLDMQSPTRGGLEAIQQERGPSILDMSKLKLFQLTVKSSRFYPIFSRVSVTHALEPMRRRQSLRVVINGMELKDMMKDGNVDFRGVL